MTEALHQASNRLPALSLLLSMAALLVSGATLAQPPQQAVIHDINPDNVQRMTMRIALPTGRHAGNAGAPLVAEGRLFLVTPFPHCILALDLARSDAQVIWRHCLRADAMALGLNSQVATPGLAYSAGRLFLNTFDGHTLALDATTGGILWDVPMTGVRQGETLATAPAVSNERVFTGNSGADFGVRGWIVALDAASGRVLWKRYNTGPDAEVGIERGFASPYLPSRPDLGTSTWPPDAWQHGGGDLMGTPVIDAASGLLFHGTGHPAPWNAEQRPGANYFTSGLFARDTATGAPRWFLPINPHDLYALGAAGSLIATDLSWQGSKRSVLLHPDANGMVYVLDRSSGELLSATPFADLNATDGVDVPAGTLRRNPAKATQVNVTTRDVCPGWPGVTGGTAESAYSPQTGLLYIPVSRLCMDMEARHTSFMSGTPFIGANLRAKAPHDGKGQGALIAWDVIAGKPSWTLQESLPVESGVLATPAGVVFYGTLGGWFKAVDAVTGKPLWQFQAKSGIVSRPISLRCADDKECIAVLSGTGGVTGAVARNDIDIRDATAANGQANAIRDLRPTDASGMLYVFGLP